MIHKKNDFIDSQWLWRKEISTLHTYIPLNGTSDQSWINLIIFSVVNCYQWKYIDPTTEKRFGNIRMILCHISVLHLSYIDK